MRLSPIIFLMQRCVALLLPGAAPYTAPCCRPEALCLFGTIEMVLRLQSASNSSMRLQAVAGSSHWRKTTMRQSTRMAIDRWISRVFSSKVQYKRIPIIDSEYISSNRKRGVMYPDLTF
ncbi:hypothetical protein L207DRAFT_74976 [Hyaloscypha variabilis F]|uniref:Secreted protein n=1 Tax=Hyaloscypha variabilis (strain UAMH 11265 / GT02V1 / F) TaxID=1149755 RepID=A0A2J6RFT1_HYAVF|nr:hypothetical protein L207DRAFT_74976 [Hyaloscypha variabilis F]